MSSFSVTHQIKNVFRVVIGVFFSIVLLSISSNASAQLATLNSTKILSSIPEIGHLDSLIAEKQQKYLQEYNDKYYATQKLISFADSMKKAVPSTAEAIAAFKNAEYAQKELQLLEGDATKTVKNFRDSLMQPYYNRINEIIKEVAQKRNFKQVIDMQQVSLLYADPSADITEEVILELKK